MKISKDFLIRMLLKKKIIIQQHYIPIFKFKKIFNQKIDIKNFKGTISYYDNAISLPIYYDLSRKKIDYIVKIIKDIIHKHGH
jgi:dTDP-4-amino-4,6-dideoxygalactose transaminase